jgi:predicted permease
MLGDWMHDVRYAVRGLVRSPGFTLTIVLTLGVGIGATTAIFATLDRLLLRSLPVAEPERLVHVVTDQGTAGINYNLSYPAFAALREAGAPFTGVLASSQLDVALTGPGGTSRVAGALVSGEYFSVLGVRAAAGRWFGADEATPGRPAPVVVVAAPWARRTFGTERGVVGREIRLNDRPFTIVGVAPDGFTGLIRGVAVDVWLPLSVMPQVLDMGDCIERPTCSWLDVFARLAPGVTAEAARSHLAVGDAARIAAGIQFEGQRRTIQSGAGGLMFAVGGLEQPLLVLMAVVVVLLIIGCGNVAGLLLVRARGRRREVAMRLALGAGRGRLLRLLLTESTVLAVLGGGVGLVAALWLGDVLASYRGAFGQPLAVPGGLDLRVLGFAALLSLTTVLVFGLMPALGASRPEVAAALKDAPETRSRAPRRVDLRDALVVGQVALSVVLVIGAALLVRTVRSLSRVDVGFDAHDVLLASVDIEMRQYPPSRTAQFYASLLERVRGLPNVRAATLATTVWPNLAGSNMGGLRLEGYEGNSDDVSFDVNRVGPDYFSTMGVGLVQGRPLEARDRGAPLVAVINQTMASRYWPAGDALGRKIWLDSTRYIEIVGIARDGKYRELREAPQATVFLPFLAAARPAATLLVRASGDPLALAPAVRAAVAELDAGVPVFDVRTLETHVGFSRSRESLAARVASLFGVIALGLAALGLYGLLAAAVRQRTREIGVRVALGARPGAVTALFMRRAVLLVGAGGLLGALIALAVTRLVGGLLFGVTATDPASYLAALGALSVAGLLAAFLPARRAVRIDPMEALRHE